jgi:hypothetical protein
MEKTILDYLKFMRTQRHQSLLDIDLAFKDTLDRRVIANMTFDSNDVLSICKEIGDTVRGIIQDELLLHSHMNVLLLQQIFKQTVLSSIFSHIRATSPHVNVNIYLLRKLNNAYSNLIWRLWKTSDSWIESSNLNRKNLPKM